MILVEKIFKDFVNEFFIFANTIYIDSTEFINKEILASISNNYFNLIICNFSSNNLILNYINKIKTKGFCLLVFFAENKPYNLGFIKENNSFYDYSVCFNDFSFPFIIRPSWLPPLYCNLFFNKSKDILF